MIGAVIEHSEIAFLYAVKREETRSSLKTYLIPHLLSYHPASKQPNGLHLLSTISWKTTAISPSFLRFTHEMAFDGEICEDLYREKGAVLMAWIEGFQTTPKCPIKRSVVQLENMRVKFDKSHLGDLDVKLRAFARSMDVIEESFHFLLVHPTGCSFDTHWAGLVAPGQIILLDIYRDRSYRPYMSEVTQAIYQEYYLMSTLRRVIFHNVVNRNTCNFIKHTGLEDLDGSWMYGTVEYQGLVGTTLGRLVCALILGAFGPGKFRITRIKVWKDSDLNMQFDIRPIVRVIASGVNNNRGDPRS